MTTNRNVFNRFTEPLFGSENILRTSYMDGWDRIYELRIALTDAFGPRGGKFMDFIAGEMSLVEYKMQCDLTGCRDYHCGMIDAVISVYLQILDFETHSGKHPEEFELWSSPEISAQVDNLRNRVSELMEINSEFKRKLKENS